MSFRPRSQAQMSRLEKETSLPMPVSSPKLTRQKLPSRLFSRKPSLGLCLVIGFFFCLLVFPIIGKLRRGLCTTSSLLIGSGLCPAILANMWHLFYHLGGNGPWIPRVSGIEYSNASLPKHCSVDQVHMLSRHAERYPTKNAGARHFDLLDRLKKPGVDLTGALSFVKSWKYFTNPEDPAFENLTATGPYAGTRQAFNTGTMLRQTYDHLVPRARRTKFWSCSSGRDIETARNFADGFFGSDWDSHGSAELVVIPEDANRGADTLTPGSTCYKYRRDGYGHDYGYGKLELWQKVFTKPIIDRLSQHAQGVQIDHLDVYSMMEMCGFEILAKGSSPWCAVFTQDEWLHFEYARDLLHFYRAGPGNSYAGAMGWLWLNATQTLMSNQSSKDVYFSFVHDGDIIPVMATLQILNEQVMLQELPTTHMKTDRRWRTSDVVPMGGRLIFERIACQTGSETAGMEHFVRLFVNDGLMKLPGLRATKHIEHGVRLDDFQDFVLSRKQIFGDFREVCSLPEDSPDRISFLHQ